jgi:hypothetical protein
MLIRQKCGQFQAPPGQYQQLSAAFADSAISVSAGLGITQIRARTEDGFSQLTAWPRGAGFQETRINSPALPQEQRTDAQKVQDRDGGDTIANNSVLMISQLSANEPERS